MSDQLGILIVGCGYWGMNYVRLFNELVRTRVVAVCDQRPERLQEVKKRFPSVEVIDNLEEALRLDGIDAAVVCTNASSHYDVARRCLEAEKHLLVEKPMATTTERAHKLVVLAEAKGVTLMVGHIFLYNSGINKVKSYIDDKQVGDIYYLYARRTNLGPVRCDVNALWDLAPHDVSILNHLLGQVPEWVSAVGSSVLKNCREDVGFMVLGYPNKVLGHVHVSWAEPNKVREIVVVGSEKRIIFNDLDPLERVRIYEKGIAPVLEDAEPSSYGEYHFSIRDGDIISPRVEVSEPLKNQCNHFLDCIMEGNCPISDGRNGLEVVRIMEAACMSMAARGAPVELDWDSDMGRPAKKLRETTYEYPARITSSIH